MGAHFFDRFRGYTGDSFRIDLISGVVVGIIAIPLGMAFAIASGVKPEYGLYSSIIAGFLVSLFGGSRFQIAGPTGAFIPILFGIAMQYGYVNLLIAGFMAGIILLLLGIFKIGGYIRFIPLSVTIGFTAGIAVIIFTGQIANFLGLRDIQSHEYFIDNIKEIVTGLPTFNIFALITSIISLVAILYTPRFLPKIPGALVGIIISTIIATLLFEGKVATIGSEFGGIPSSLPTFNFPEITYERFVLMLVPAITIAALGAIESLLSCVVADGMTGTKHNSNRELIGQGIANMVTPLFGGIAATGAIARTATNIKTGAVSPVSGIIHSIVVLIIILLFAPYASLIPLASMAPIIMIVAWNMIKVREFVHILKTTKGDGVVLVVTFLLTVFTNLTVAVPVGFMLALVLFVKNMSDVHRVEKVLPDHKDKDRKMDPKIIEDGSNCPQISIFNLEGPLFFGVAQDFEEHVIEEIYERPKAVILKMHNVPFLDATGEDYLRNVIKRFQRNRIRVILVGLQAQPLSVLKNTSLMSLTGEENIFEGTREGIEAALYEIEHSACVGCPQFAFSECRSLSLGKLPWEEEGVVSQA